RGRGRRGPAERRRGRGPVVRGRLEGAELAAVAVAAVPVGQGTRPDRGAGRAVHAGEQVDVRPQVAGADLDEVVALLPQHPGDRPVAVDGDVHDGDADAEVLGVADDLREVLVAADQDRVGERAVAGEGHQVAVDLGVDALAAAGADAAEPQLEAGQFGQRVVLGGAAALDRGLVPVAAQEGQSGPFSGEVAQELQEPAEVPRDGVAMACAVHRHRAVGQQVAGVYEQRAAIHATPPFLNTGAHTRAQPAYCPRA